MPSMRTLVSATFALGACLLAGGICHAQFAPAASPGNAPVVKQEPFDGMMSPSAIVLVDDGSCGKGRIKEVTGGEARSWAELTEETPSQIVMGSETDQKVFALSLRSAEGVLYYLGQLARLEAGAEKQPRGGRAVMIHVCDYDQDCATDDGEPPRLPLFVALAKRDHQCSDSFVSVRSLDGTDYFIPKGDQVPPADRRLSPLLLTSSSGLCAEGRTMMALTLVSQLIGLQKTAKDFTTTSTVKVVGQ